MARAKFSLETRVAVVQHYLPGNGSGMRRTANFFGMHKSTVSQRVISHTRTAMFYCGFKGIFLSMTTVIASLEDILLPFAVKIRKQPHVNAIKNGFIKLMPITLVGTIFALINNVFLSFGEGSFFFSLGVRLESSTIETLNEFKAIGGNVYNGTLGIMSLMTGLLSVAAFMTVTPQSVGEAYAVGANWLGGANIMSGIIIGLVVAEMFTFIICRNWVITLPDKGLRTIPEIFDIIKDVQKICPDAWVINFTNPAGMVIEAVYRHTDFRRFIGVCNIARDAGD